ncbi:hypothetical protein [[Bacillus] enclensis]|uniref:hypothetical protein n=1 Tax=[Bacillus] enclensis TaxID=1402860 RepID=UPI0018DCC35F|nr:hypothetical protein [[Bacillus] enclensis]MBH9966806.1 hypothetical protein [[Bacillus] enclensis]
MKNRISSILITGCLFLSLTACSTTGSSTTSNSSEEANTPEVTQEELSKITKGTELEEVIKIIGGEGKQQGESGKPGTKAHQVSYVWDGATPNSFVSISFRNNKVSTINAMNMK